MPHRTLEDFEAAAKALRVKLLFEQSLRPDMMTAAYKMKNLGIIRDYARKSFDQMPEDEAQFNSDTGVLQIREDTLEGANRSAPRAVMTLAHEFGHVALEHKGILHRNTRGRRIEQIYMPIKIAEIEAKRFGAVFVAPAYLCSDMTDVTAEDLQRRFPISAQASIIRASEITTLRRRASGQERRLPDSVAEFLRDAKARGIDIKTKLD